MMHMVHGWCFPESDQLMANELNADGTYQLSHLNAALAYVTDWSLAGDLGAHVGTWSRILSGRFQRVIAAEPSPDTFEALVANLRAFDCANVEARQVALGDAAGMVSMVLDGRGATLHNTGARYVKAGGAIPVETIDSWELPALGFLKLDVEGSEIACLRGARETLQRCRPIVIYEEKGFGRRYGATPEMTQALLRAVGYRELQIVSCDQIWGPR